MEPTKNRIRILLIYPPVTVYGMGKVRPHFPLGLAYLAAYLEREGYEVKIVDALALGKDREIRKGKLTMVGLSDGGIKREIKKYKPDVVGISVMFTPFEEDAVRVAGLAKEVNKNIVTVVGGAHVSIDPKRMVRRASIDFAVKGEGEVTFLELIRTLEGKGKISEVEGLTYKEGGKIISNKNRQLISRLDDLPFPALHLLDVKAYDDPTNKYLMRRPLFPIITSRGCPNHCVYCSIHSLWEHRWRGRSAKNVVDEIEHLVNNYGAAEICLQDDSASVDKKRFFEICDEIIKRKLDIKWTTPNGIAHWTLDKDLLLLMKKAGCYRITFGIESGNPEMRRWVGKVYSLDQARELTRFANKIGMWTVATNIIGFPYETKNQIEDTINYAIDSDVDLALFFRLSPRLGTPVYDVFKKEGWLPKNRKELFSEEVATETKYIKGKELFEIQSKAYRKFFKKRVISFLNPIRILRKIRSLEDARYVFRLTGAGISLIKNVSLSKSGVTSKAYRE